MLCSTVVLALAWAARAAETPSEDTARAAFETARAWVDAVAVPHADSPDARFKIDGASGACVLLWRSGRVVGTGADWTGDELMLRRAVARALGELLGEPAVRNLPDDMRDSAGRLVSIELEIASEPTPIVAPSFEHAGRQLDPGIDGVAMRRNQDWAMRFPAQFRATNTAGGMHHQFLALAADLGLAPAGLTELKSKHNTAAYSFNATTLAQTAPDAAPFLATRGEQVVDIEVVTPEALRNWASASAAHLLEHLGVADEVAPGEPPQPIGLTGTYNPFADSFDTVFAPPVEQALGAFALSRAAQSTHIPPELRDSCAEATKRILLELTQTTPVETEPTESAAACALIGASMDDAMLADEALAELHARAAKRLMDAFVPAKGFDAALTPHERAIVAWGLVQLSHHDPLTMQASTAQAAVEEAWQGVAEHERVALLPWIGWAMRDLAGRDGTPEHADELRELAIGLCASRVAADHRTFAADLEGGLPLVSSGRAQPTSQTLRPASWLASVLRDPHIIPPAERDKRLADLHEVMRFVRQLMVRDESAWRYRNKRRALGGFRAAPWDMTQPVPAQALGLITLLEASRTLQNAENQQPDALHPRKSP